VFSAFLTRVSRPPQLRHGLASAGRSAAFGGVLLAGIEGIGILITRMTAPPPPPGLDEMAVGMAGASAGAPGGLAAAPPAPAADGPLAPAPDASGGASGGGGWFGGIFGGSSRKAGQSSAGASEAPPMPDFGAGSSGGVKFE
jgi:import inner membrane translocase subunit TIM17